MTIEVLKEDAPAHWASYLINGDASGLEDSEQAECDAWQESLQPAYVVSTEDDDEGHFGRFNFPGRGTLGCTLITYILHQRT